MDRTQSTTDARTESLTERLEQLGSEAQHLQHCQDVLLHQFADVRNALSNNRKESERVFSALHPPFPIPPEILCIIFKWGQVKHAGRGYGAHPTYLERHFPLTVSHVCRYWREISINMASLWTRIDYGCQNAYACELRSSHLVALYLQRSKGQPLDILLSSRYYGYDYDVMDTLLDPDIDYPDVQQAIDLIFANVSRWKSLSIHIAGDADFQEIQMRLRTLSTPLLEWLWIDGTGEPRWMGGFRRVLKGGSPALQHVKIDGGAISCCCPPLASVKVLDMLVLEVEDDSVTARTFRGLLSGAISLRTLHVPLAVIRPYHSHVAPVTIPTLRFLKVDGSSGKQQTMQMLLDLISAPQLECLVFYRLTSSDIESISSYLTSSSGPSKFPVLRTLQFNRTSNFNPITEGLMSSLPTITRLGLTQSPFANTLRILSTTTLWPSLDTLQLGSSALSPLLFEMLHHRVHIGHPIAKLRFLVDKAVTVDISVRDVTVELLDKYTHREEDDPSAYFDD